MVLSRKLVTLSNRLTRSLKDKLYDSLPVINFRTEHIVHCISLVDRKEMLHLLPRHAIVAEIGVNKGDFSEKILRICAPEKLILIDVWASRR